jgi:SPP1 gp7 family putative phage head morphogenesis protein
LAGATTEFRGKYPRPGKLVGVASKSGKAEVRRLLARIADELQDLPRNTIREFIPVLYAAQQELERDLLRWIRSVEDGAHRFTAHQYRVMLRQIRESLRVIESLHPTLLKSLQSGSIQAAGLSNQWLSREMARLSEVFGGPGGTLPALDIPTLSHLAERNKWLLTRFDKASRRYTRNIKLSIRRQLSVGVARGETMNEMAIRLMRFMPGARGIGDMGAEKIAAQMAKGLFHRAYFESERIIRTELMNAYNAHHQRSIEENALIHPEMMKRWDASADRHCTLCHAVDGEIVKPDETFSSGDMYPPLHPNCRCLVTPWMSHWPEVKPLPPLDTPDAKRYSHQGGAVVTSGGTAKETNRALRKKGRDTPPETT